MSNDDQKSGTESIREQSNKDIASTGESTFDNSVNLINEYPKIVAALEKYAKADDSFRGPLNEKSVSLLDDYYNKYTNIVFDHQETLKKLDKLKTQEHEAHKELVEKIVTAKKTLSQVELARKVLSIGDVCEPHHLSPLKISEKTEKVEEYSSRTITLPFEDEDWKNGLKFSINLISFFESNDIRPVLKPDPNGSNCWTLTCNGKPYIEISRNKSHLQINWKNDFQPESYDIANTLLFSVLELVYELRVNGEDEPVLKSQYIQLLEPLSFHIDKHEKPTSWRPGKSTYDVATLPLKDFEFLKTEKDSAVWTEFLKMFRQNFDVKWEGYTGFQDLTCTDGDVMPNILLRISEENQLPTQSLDFSHCSIVLAGKDKCELVLFKSTE